MIAAAYLILVAICFFFVLKGLRYGTKHSSFEPAKQQRLFLRITTGILVWTLLISVMAATGIFQNFDTLPPRITLTLMPPMVFVLIMTWRSGNLKEILKNIPVHWLIYLQSFRIAVELILWWHHKEGVVPIQMTFEGQNFDVMAGLTAPIIGYLYAKKGKSMRKLALAWNIVGLLLLFNILTIAILSFPTRLRYFMNEPANTFVAEFPFVLLPGFLVAVAYSMHFFSIKQLLKR